MDNNVAKCMYVRRTADGRVQERIRENAVLTKWYVTTSAGLQRLYMKDVYRTSMSGAFVYGVVAVSTK